MHVGTCWGAIYFPESPRNSPASACRDSNLRSKTLNKCEEATPIKTGNRECNITQGLRRKSGVTWKTEGIGMHGWCELKKTLLPLQATKKLREGKYWVPWWPLILAHTETSHHPDENQPALWKRILNQYACGFELSSHNLQKHSFIQAHKLCCVAADVS